MRPAHGEPRHLFICGLHRSGTSPLHRLLRAQPGVSGMADPRAKEDEGQYLQQAVPIGEAFGGPGQFRVRPEEPPDGG